MLEMNSEYRDLDFNDERILSKICNMDCSFETLEAFVIAVSNKIDKYNDFDKYYDVNKIITVIEKYQNGQIDEKYLAYWTNAYNWILQDSFVTEDDKMGFVYVKTISLKEFIWWILSEILDSISFYDEDISEYYNFNDIKKEIKQLDKLIKDNEKGQCKASFAILNSEDNNKIVVLIINEVEEYYAKLYGYLDYNNLFTEFNKITHSAFFCKVSRLKKKGYKELTIDMVV